MHKISWIFLVVLAVVGWGCQKSDDSNNSPTPTVMVLTASGAEYRAGCDDQTSAVIFGNNSQLSVQEKIYDEDGWEGPERNGASYVFTCDGNDLPRCVDAADSRHHLIVTSDNSFSIYYDGSGACTFTR